MIELSIVIPVYNGAVYIKETTENILKNTSDKFEVILVNDGSKDDSEKVCEQIQAADDRVKLFEKSNGGIADARNFGMYKARGKYLAFVDQDDRVNVETVLSIVQKCMDFDSDVGMFSTQYRWEEQTSDCDKVERNTALKDSEIFYKMLWPMVYPTAEDKVSSYIGHVWAGVYKREFILNNIICFQKMITIEDDYLFVFETLLHAKRAITDSRVGYYWTVNPHSTTYNPQYVENMLEKCHRYYDYVQKELEKKQEFTGAYARAYKKMSVQLTAVRFVINEGIYQNKNKIASYHNLNKYLSRLGAQKMMNGPYLGAGASRRSAYLIYSLLCKKMYASAIMFSTMIGWGNRMKMLRRIKNG